MEPLRLDAVIIGSGFLAEAFQDCTDGGGALEGAVAADDGTVTEGCANAVAPEIRCPACSGVARRGTGQGAMWSIYRTEIRLSRVTRRSAENFSGMG
jgi:hypothetical protein